MSRSKNIVPKLLSFPLHNSNYPGYISLNFKHSSVVYLIQILFWRSFNLLLWKQYKSRLERNGARSDRKCVPMIWLKILTDLTDVIDKFFFFLQSWPFIFLFTHHVLCILMYSWVLGSLYSYSKCDVSQQRKMTKA